MDSKNTKWRKLALFASRAILAYELLAINA
jgi:hypothetical protein